MKGYAQQKVSGGKLVGVRVEYTDKIDRIQILGDFFMHPEESIFKIEEALLGAPLSESEWDIAERIRRVADANKVEMLGVTPEAIAATIKLAVKRDEV